MVGRIDVLSADGSYETITDLWSTTNEAVCEGRDAGDEENAGLVNPDLFSRQR